MMHPAYRGLADFGALKQRSDDTYDQEDQDLRSAPDYGSFNNTMSVMNNQASKISPWAPYFQALQDQGVNKVGMDAGRPHGLASNPSWALQGDVGNLAGVGDQIAAPPLMKSTNIAGPQAPSEKSLALNGLEGALDAPSRGRFGAGLKPF